MGDTYTNLDMRVQLWEFYDFVLSKSRYIGSFETYLVSTTLSFGLGLLGFRRPV